jgi:hypothetical protein
VTATALKWINTLHSDYGWSGFDVHQFTRSGFQEDHDRLWIDGEQRIVNAYNWLMTKKRTTSVNARNDAIPPAGIGQPPTAASVHKGEANDDKVALPLDRMPGQEKQGGLLTV